MDANSVQMLVAVAAAHSVAAPQPLTAEQIAELPSRHGTVIQAVQGDAEIEGRRISVVVGLRQGFPCALPLVFIQPWDAFGMIPHVETDGYVCSAQHEGLILDPNRYEDVLSESLASALEQVRRGAQRRNFADFADEFQAYWNRQRDLLRVCSFVTPTSEPSLLRCTSKGMTMCACVTGKRTLLTICRAT
jgi:hypothetical protein